MRRILTAAIASLTVLLAACGGTPTPAPAPPTAIPAPTAEGTIERAADAQVFSLPTGDDIAGIPDTAPGTLVLRTDNTTPGAPTRAPIEFRVISLYQQGGIGGVPLDITVFADGRLIRDGVTTRLSTNQIALLSEQIVALQFLDIDGTFSGAGASPDVFQYTLTIESPQGGRTLVTQDGMTPDSLLALYDTLKGLRGT
ncbi:MAG: hypothetical protein SGJ24_18595 [Chloroflexota bacterium]|nr:hypothetical protein [Chloroflexota bacterium]